MNFNRRGTEAKQKINTYTMKKIVIAISILMMSISCGEIFAQKDGFSLHLSGVFPNGDFGDVGYTSIGASPSTTSIGGAASTGFGLGVKYQRSISLVKNLRAMFEANIMYNPLQGEMKDIIEKEILPGCEMLSSSVSISKYLNIPLMAGLNYSFDLAEKIKLYGELGVGLNVRLITKTSAEYEYEYPYWDWDSETGEETTRIVKEKGEGKYKFNQAVSFAYQVGVGVLLFEKLSVGLNYYNLGSAKVKGTYTYSSGRESNLDINGISISTSMLTLKVGYHF